MSEEEVQYMIEQAQEPLLEAMRHLRDEITRLRERCPERGHNHPHEHDRLTGQPR